MSGVTYRESTGRGEPLSSRTCVPPSFFGLVSCLAASGHRSYMALTLSSKAVLLANSWAESWQTRCRGVYPFCRRCEKHHAYSRPAAMARRAHEPDQSLWPPPARDCTRSSASQGLRCGSRSSSTVVSCPDGEPSPVSCHQHRCSTFDPVGPREEASDCVTALAA